MAQAMQALIAHDIGTPVMLDAHAGKRVWAIGTADSPFGCMLLPDWNASNSAAVEAACGGGAGQLLGIPSLLHPDPQRYPVGRRFEAAEPAGALP